LRLGEGWSLLITIVVVVVLVGATWYFRLEWAHVYAAIEWVVAKLLVWDWFIELIQKIPLRWALPIVILAPLVWWFIKECLDPLVSRFVLYMRSKKAAMWRKLLLFWKNLKGAKGNLLWVFKALPVVVLVVAPVAWVSLVFAKLFQWATRDPSGLDNDHA
jgi:hypothetical protein